MMLMLMQRYCMAWSYGQARQSRMHPNQGPRTKDLWTGINSIKKPRMMASTGVEAAMEAASGERRWGDCTSKQASPKQRCRFMAAVVNLERACRPAGQPQALQHAGHAPAAGPPG